MTSPPVPQSFVAVGDSFSEGLDDPSLTGDGSFRGWADRVAEHFAERTPDVSYANLAIRGRLLKAIVAEQVPNALALEPELVSFAGGTNDLLRPSVDLDALSRTFDDAVRRLRVNGSQVVLFQAVLPRAGLLGRSLPRLKALTTLVEEVADRYECVLVKLWGEPVFTHPSIWSIDRLHLSPEGHARVAGAVLEALGLGDHRWAAEPGPYDVDTVRLRLTSDVLWTRRYLAPWVVRRLRGTSSGDRIAAKRPALSPVNPPPESGRR